VFELALKHGKVILYYHNLRYDSQFLRGFFHGCETGGWKLKAMIRKGSPIKIKLSLGRECSIEFRDSLKKLPVELKAVGQIYGLAK